MTIPHKHTKLSKWDKNKQQQSHTQKLLTGHVLIRPVAGPELRGIVTCLGPPPIEQRFYVLCNILLQSSTDRRFN